MGSTFWLLDGRNRWLLPSGEKFLANGVIARGVITLAEDARGPLALSAEDGSLGGLTLPRGMAVDDTRLLYLLDESTGRIKRFDLERQQFEPLPAVGSAGDGIRAAAKPLNIAIAGRNLYVVDGDGRRVQVFALDGLALRHVWGPWDWTGSPVPGDDEMVWNPCDVAALGRRACVLDGRYGCVYEHRAGADPLRRLIHVREMAGRWTRIALDRDGRIYLLDEIGECLDVFDQQGRYVETLETAGEARDYFDPPAIRLDHRGRFCLPSSMARACDRRLPDPPPSPQLPLGSGADAERLIFDRTGRRATVQPGEPAGPCLYLTGGEAWEDFPYTTAWISPPLDSRIYYCQWHRLVLDIAALPPGAQITVSTYTADLNPDDTLPDVKILPAQAWLRCLSVTGPMQPDPSAPTSRQEDGLVQNREGQYLWIKIELRSNGYSVPAVSGIQAHYPRESYLAHLPEVYASDDEGRRFTERFLSIFQTTWDELEERVASSAQLFDPQAAPDDLIPYLASWLALPLAGNWDNEQRRRMVAAAPGFYHRRGTVASLRRYLQACLANISGVEPDQQRGFPGLIECFQLRRYMQLAISPFAELESERRVALWGPGTVGRLQLDVFAREGEVRLVSTGDPVRDVFHEYAHQFRVYVPAVWVRTAADERLLRQALDAEKPAHTRYDLCLVEPRLRVGVQSTVGLDTIIGAYPVARLACDEPDGDSAPPSQEPRQRLGYDTVLAGARSPMQPPQLAPSIRVGTTLS